MDDPDDNCAALIIDSGKFGEMLDGLLEAARKAGLPLTGIVLQGYCKELMIERHVEANWQITIGTP